MFFVNVIFYFAKQNYVILYIYILHTPKSGVDQVDRSGSRGFESRLYNRFFYMKNILRKPVSALIFL